MKLSDKLAMSAGHVGVWVGPALEGIRDKDWATAVVAGGAFVVALALAIKYGNDIDEALLGRKGE